MASSLEFNKVAAAVLAACVIGSLSGFFADVAVHPHELQKAVYAPAGAEKAAEPAKGAAPAGPEPIEPLLASVTPQQGEDVAKKCTVCHTFNKGEPNKVGPNLFGIVGDKIAEGRNYQYSDALKSKHGEWTVDMLNDWLYKPQAFAKGTKMTFAGLPKAEDRAAVIKYLESLK